MNHHNLYPQNSETERFREIARIFAAGIRRLRARAALSAHSTDNLPNSPESGQKALEVLEETVLSVSHVS